MATPFTPNTTLSDLLQGNAPQGLNFSQEANPFEVAQATGQYDPLQMPELAKPNRYTPGSVMWALTGGADAPTQEQYQAQQLGQGQAQAIHGISARIQSGMTPQRAIMDFAGSPEGMNFFTNGGGFSDLANIVKGLTPAGPSYEKLGANESLVRTDGAGGPEVVLTAPNADVNKATALMDLGNLTAEERSYVARQMLNKDMTGDLSAAEAAMSRLVKQGRISQKTSDLILGGVLKPTPIMDAAGNTIGYGVADLSQQGNITMLPNTTSATPGQIPTPGTKDYAEGITPGTKPEDLPDNGPQFQNMTNPADIVDAAGPVGVLTEKIGNLLGAAFPSLAATETTQKRNMLARIRSDAISLSASSGRTYSTELNDLRSLADTTQFLTTNPADAAQTLLNLHDAYDNLERAALDIRDDPQMTGKARGEAVLDLANIKKARANLPTRASLTQKLEDIKAQAPLEAVTKGLSEVEQNAAKAGLIDQPTDTGNLPTYTGMDQLRADWKAGKLKKGQQFILNGKTQKIDMDYPR